MNLTPQLTTKLKQLRLSGILDTLEVRNRQAIDQKLSFTEFLMQLATDEVDRREQKKLTTRLRRASFPSSKTLEGFDFDARPHLNRALIYDLATCSFIEEKSNVLIVGPSGVGKSHLAQALGHTACRRGYDVLYMSMTKMLGHLNSGRADGSYERRFANLARADLLILDDFGLKALKPPSDEDFHELIAERHERNPIIITSNLDFGEWGQAFSNPLLASASVDRLRDNAHCLVVEGDSHRRPRPPAGAAAPKTAAKSKSRTGSQD
jgi:DNA replication protein DnaC